MQRRPWRFRRSSGGVWTPADAVAPLLAWYRADLGVTAAGGLVSAVADQSGSGDANRNLAEASLKPTLNASNAAYGNHPTFDFSGSQLPAVGAWSSPPTRPITVLVIGNADASGLVPFLSCSSAGAFLLWRHGGAVDLRWQVNNGGVPPGVKASGLINAPTAMMITDTGPSGAATLAMYLNDLSTPAPSATNTTLALTGIDRFDLGKANSGLSNLTGSIAEACIWGGLHGAPDLAELKTYLNITRPYGIAVT